jgi:ABC-type sugar transport system permease subunit
MKAEVSVLRKKRNKGLETMRARYGYAFVFPWIIGLLVFFIEPLFSSIWYAFCDVLIEPGGIATKFVSLENFKWLLFKDPDFLDRLVSSLGYMFYSFPLIIAFSLVVAIMLNREFFGRTMMRMLFFLPIVITASAILPLLGGEDVRLPIFYGEGTDNAVTILEKLQIPDFLSSFCTFMLTSATKIIYSSAVQIILFIGGLQNIPASLYEVSQIEGANKWEEFWLITVPSLRHVISLVIIYTMIELFTSTDNWIVQRAYNWITTQDYDKSSALLWMYFLIVIVVIGAIYGAYTKFCMKKWE